MIEVAQKQSGAGRVVPTSRLSFGLQRCTTTCACACACAYACAGTTAACAYCTACKHLSGWRGERVGVGVVGVGVGVGVGVHRVVGWGYGFDGVRHVMRGVAQGCGGGGRGAVRRGRGREQV